MRFDILGRVVTAQVTSVRDIFRTLADILLPFRLLPGLR